MIAKNISLKDIFIAFLKMGTFAYGGVYSMLAFFEKELVGKKKWLTHDEFTESVAMGQMTPGAPIVNTGIFIGYKIAGFWGGITTVIGQTLPAFIKIIILATVYLQHKELHVLQSALKGIGAAVVGLVFSVVINMGQKTLKKEAELLLFAIALAAAVLLHINPLLILAVSGLTGYLLYRKR